jgi:hypothetical protein
MLDVNFCGLAVQCIREEGGSGGRGVERCGEIAEWMERAG